MRVFYVEILCKIGSERFIESGLLEHYGEYLIYRDLRQGFIESYKSMRDFKEHLVYDKEDFNQYCKLVELR